MKQETLSDALGLVDDDILEETEAVRNRKKLGKNHWKRWTALAACLCLLVGGIAVFLQGFPIIGGKCGGNIGLLVNGSYYYKTDYAFYRYAAGEREQLMSSFFVDSGWKVDEFGLYYVKGHSLYVREHESGKSRKLYAADTEIWIRYLENNQITLWLRDENKLFDDLQPYVCVDAKSGEVVWQSTLTEDEELAIINSGNTYGEYPAGGHVFKEVFTDERYELYLDGEPFLPEGQYGEFNLSYCGDNLLVSYQDTTKSRSAPEYILAKPDGEMVKLPSGYYLTGTDDILLFVDDVWLSTPYDLYGYDTKTGETVLLLANADVYYAVTDGTWLYTNVPWSGRTDCWKLIYDDAGKLICLELVESDI